MMQFAYSNPVNTTVQAPYFANFIVPPPLRIILGTLFIRVLKIFSSFMKYMPPGITDRINTRGSKFSQIFLPGMSRRLLPGVDWASMFITTT